MMWVSIQLPFSLGRVINDFPGKILALVITRPFERWREVVSGENLHGRELLPSYRPRLLARNDCVRFGQVPPQGVQSGLLQRVTNHGTTSGDTTCHNKQLSMINVVIWTKAKRHHTELSNLWWMPSSVSKGFGLAVGTGSPRRATTYVLVSSQVSLLGLG